MNKLKLTIQSFSYKNGIPKDMSGNGGGFVFDCRGIYNPGRMEKHKTKTGLDPEVIEFLENETKMTLFLTSIQEIVDLTIENYIERGFSHLQIAFGCTGGQHRSVYATEKMTDYLSQQFPMIQIEKEHLNKGNWVI